MDAKAVEGRTEELLGLLRSRRRLLVLTHANPDPDSLASAMGLRLLAEERASMSTQFAYCGRILRAENREMVQICKIDMVEQEELDVGQFDCLAVLDTQPGFGHTHLPAGRDIDIVVDHHVPPENGDANAAPTPLFNDLRPYIGATSTMVAGYLMDAEVVIPSNVATALFYGIKTDTADLSRNASPLDEKAYDHLIRLVDRKALARITTPSLTREYYETLREALNSVRIYNEVMLCSLGCVHSPEMVAEVADLLLRLEGRQTVFCGGLVDQTYYVSVRTELERDAYYLIKSALGGEGSFGGHGTVAGGCVHLPDNEQRTLKRLERRIERNVLQAMGIEGVSVSTFGGSKD